MHIECFNSISSFEMIHRHHNSLLKSVNFASLANFFSIVVMNVRHYKSLIKQFEVEPWIFDLYFALLISEIIHKTFFLFLFHSITSNNNKNDFNFPFFFCSNFSSLIHRDTRPSPLIHCRMLHDNVAIESSEAPDHRSEARLRIDPKVLVFVETTYSRLGRDIAELLVYNRIK